MPQYFKDLGEQLLDHGYLIVPLPPGSKGPRIKGWPSLALDKPAFHRMAANGSADAGIGVLARYTPAIDVDILDKSAADEMSLIIDEIFAGQALMTRTGRAPKFLIPFRSDDPFKKLTSNVYTDGTHDHKIEILGDGQQWVAYHVHPETGKPYEWWDGLGDAGIMGSAQSELPALSRSDAQRVIDAFEVLAATRVASGAWRAKDVGQRPDIRERGGDDPFSVYSEPVGKSEIEVRELLARHPNEEADYDHWFKVLAAVHHELGDAGEDIARTWSTEAHKHTDEKFDLTWNSLGRYTGRQLTLRSLLKGEKPSAPEKSLEGNEFVQAAQFASEQRIEWLVKKVLPKSGLTIIYGEPGSGKSFFALDLVAHVARGLPWRGLRTKQCSVAYVAAEGVAGFGNRLKAYGEGHGVDLSVLPVYVRGGQLAIKEQAVAIVDAVLGLPHVGVIVIDTLAAVTPGANENVSEDMGVAIERANFIIQSTGAAVILIHHSTKDGGTLRGWSGLLGAADSTIKIERRDDKRTAHIEKMKEGEDSGKYGFKLRIVDLGQDDDGDPVTSCVVDESKDIAEKGNKKERKPRSGDFETSDNYIKARDFLAIIERAMGVGVDASMTEDEIVEAIQADPKTNEMGQDDYPPRRYITPTLRTLVQKGKICREGRAIKLCA